MNLLDKYFEKGIGLWGVMPKEKVSTVRPLSTSDTLSVKDIQYAVRELEKVSTINPEEYMKDFEENRRKYSNIKKVSFPVEHEHEWVFTTDDPDDTEISCVLCGIVSTETYADDYIEIPPKKVFMTKEELFWYRFCVLAGVVCVISWIVMLWKLYSNF